MHTQKNFCQALTAKALKTKKRKLKKEKKRKKNRGLAMQPKAQGSLEYLLIIGGGLLIAVIVIGAVVALAGTGTSGTKHGAANQVCKTYWEQTECENADLAIIERVTANCPTGTLQLTECCWDDSLSSNQKCYVNPRVVYS